jgi:hypothetical protein
MDGYALLFALMGFLLRYVLPLAGTVVVVWLLRWLDARWQAEAGRLPVSAPPVLAGPTCWQVQGCPPERRVTCPAFLNPTTPCWQLFRDRDGNLRAGCLACEFFRAAPAPRQTVERHALAH